MEEDKIWARNRIAELDGAIQDLGPEFYDVFNQSSETWHDNAPFDALRDRQSVLDAERQQLKLMLRQVAVGVPKPKKGIVGIGSVVKVRQKSTELMYKIAGDWTYQAGELVDGERVVSLSTPVAQELVGKKIGATTKFGEILEIWTS